MTTGATNIEPRQRGSERRAPVIVIGAGPTGLAAAYRLQEAGVPVVVLEAGDRVGGKMESIRQDGFLMETGPSIVPSTYAAVRKLAADIGLSDELVDVSSVMNIVTDTGTYPVDVSKPMSIVKSRLLSWRSKLAFARAVPDFLRSYRKLSYADLSSASEFDGETALQYSNRKLTREIYDNLVDASLRGLVGTSADVISNIVFLFSVKIIGGKLSVWKNGYASFGDRLAERLDVKFGARVLGVVETDGGVEVTWCTANGEVRTDTARGCILAVPGNQVPDLYGQLDPACARFLRGLVYSYCVNVNVALSRRPKLPGYMLMPSAATGSNIIGMSLEHNIAGRAPAGKGLLGIYAISHWSEEMMDADDDVIIDELMADAKRVLPELSDGEVEFVRVSRRYPAVLVSQAGGCAGIGLLRERTGKGRVHLAGDYFSYSCVNTAVTAGERAAKELLAVVGVDA